MGGKRERLTIDKEGDRESSLHMVREGGIIGDIM